MYRLMLNNGGPRSGFRKVVGSMVHYVLLYVATMWQKALVYNKIRKYLEHAQRRVHLAFAAHSGLSPQRQPLLFLERCPSRSKYTDESKSDQRGALEEDDHYVRQ